MIHKINNTLILILIIVIGGILRFYNYIELPFTHDEFSALFRTEFNTFSELIEYGVKVDGHPAGIQVLLYYWTKCFGSTEPIVKLPFILFGLGSIIVFYRITKEWFNETVGLICASYIASIQFTIMYSQIARPYISGLFFCLLMVYYWTKIIKSPNKNYTRNYLLFITSTSLCAYNHHFSLLFAAIVGFSGLFFINKNRLISYIFSGVIIFLIYLPHLNIFLYHLSVGGVGGPEAWLAKPQKDFIIDFIMYIFNYSTLSLVVVATLIIINLDTQKIRSAFNSKTILFIIWFLLPLLIGYFYSVYVNAVLQFSVLIFSFPFLLFILFGHIKTKRPTTNLVIVTIILATNIFSTVWAREHYKLFYESPFEHILLDYRTTNETKDNVISFIDSHKRKSQHYLKRHNISTNFIWLDTFKTDRELILYLNSVFTQYDYLYLGVLSSNNPKTVPIIQEYFPTIVWQENYAGGTTYLFSKASNFKHKWSEILTFENKDNNSWKSLVKTNYTDSISYSGNYSYLIDDLTEWSPNFTVNLNDIITEKTNFIDISLKAKCLSSFDGVRLVATLEVNDEFIYWGGSYLNEFTSIEDSFNNWITAVHSVKLSDIRLEAENIKLKIFIWNKKSQNFLIDDFSITVRDGNPIIYGLYQDF